MRREPRRFHPPVARTHRRSALRGREGRTEKYSHILKFADLAGRLREQANRAAAHGHVLRFSACSSSPVRSGVVVAAATTGQEGPVRLRSHRPIVCLCLPPHYSAVVHKGKQKNGFLSGDKENERVQPVGRSQLATWLHHLCGFFLNFEIKLL